MNRLAAFAVFVLLALASPKARAADGDYVVLLHGIARTSVTMLAFEKYFELQGYQPVNIDYPSQDKPIAALAELVHEAIEDENLDPARKVHFVGYSMGGLIIRAYLHKHRPQNLGRVVMVGTPHHGSEVADALKHTFFYEALFGPAGQELSTKFSRLHDRYGAIDYDLGVIAGRMTVDPVSSAIIPGPDDGKVSVASTRLDGMKDHIVMNTTHAFMCNNPFVIGQAAHFIEHGSFERAVDEKPQKPAAARDMVLPN